MTTATSTTTTTTPEPAKTPRVRYEETVARRLVARITKMAARLDKYGSEEVAAHFASASASIGAVADCLAAMPDDVGTKARNQTATLDIGVKVDVKARYVKNYEDLLEEADLCGLEIFKVARGKLGVVTTDGVRMFLPKSHLVPAGATQPAE